MYKNSKTMHVFIVSRIKYKNSIVKNLAYYSQQDKSLLLINVLYSYMNM